MNGVIITHIHRDMNGYGLTIDISLEKQMIDVFGIDVTCENGNLNFDLPDIDSKEPFDYSKRTKAIQFMPQEEWYKIRDELKKEIAKDKWLTDFLFDSKNSIASPSPQDNQ